MGRAAGNSGFDRAADGMGFLDKIANRDGHAVVGRDLQAKDVGPFEVIACCPGQGRDLPAGLAAHEQEVGLAAFHGITELVEHSKGEGRAAGSARRDELVGSCAGGDELDEAVELVGVGGVVAIDELILKLILDGLGGQLDDRALDIVDIGAGLADIVVHVGVLAEDGQGGRLLHEGDGRAGAPVIIDRVPFSAGKSKFAVIGERVAVDLDPRHERKQGRFLNDGFDDALLHDVIGKFGVFGEGSTHLFLVLLNCVLNFLPGREA